MSYAIPGYGYVGGGAGSFAIPGYGYIELPPAATMTLKTVNGLPIGSIKTIQGLAKANVKTYDGLTP